MNTKKTKQKQKQEKLVSWNKIYVPWKREIDHKTTALQLKVDRTSNAVQSEEARRTNKVGSKFYYMHIFFAFFSLSFGQAVEQTNS